MAGSPGMQMAGMDMSNPQMSGTASELGWVAAVNWFATVGFGAAARCWLYRYFAARRTDAVPNSAHLAHIGPLCQGFMAAGAAIMFGVTL